MHSIVLHGRRALVPFGHQAKVRWSTLVDMYPDVPVVPLKLWRSDAIVLFDWLMSVDLDAVPITHPAQKQALMDLLTRLEETDITGVTQADIDAASGEVAADMGW